MIAERIKELAALYLKPIEKVFAEHIPADSAIYVPPPFYMGGGCFKSLNYQRDCDIDLFSPVWEEFQSVHVSKNAITSVKDGRTIQFCKHWKDSLEKMVDSFDFAHTQCGVLITPQKSEDGLTFHISEPFFTPAWAEWINTGKTDYTGTDYPLSSLIRAGKLFKKDLLKPKEYQTMLLRILIDVAERGFKDGADLREQLDAIDLAYVVEDNKSTIYRLVEVLPSKNISSSAS
jgi:hypothetical protein